MDFKMFFMHIFDFIEKVKAKGLTPLKTIYILCQIGQSGGNMCVAFFPSAISDTAHSKDLRAVVRLSFCIHSLMISSMGALFSQMFHIHLIYLFC